MTDTDSETKASPQDQFAKRDAETQIALGIFVTVISIPVLVGTFWANSFRAMVVNLAAGAVLLGVGLAMGILGFMRKKSS